MKLHIKNKNVIINQKQTFFSYYNKQIKIAVKVAICIIIVSVILMLYSIFKDEVTFFMNNYLFVLFITIAVIYFFIKIIQIISYLRAYLFIPVTHDELEKNNIFTKEEYLLTIFKLFHWIPQREALNNILDICSNEFSENRLFLHNYYFEEPSLLERILLYMFATFITNIIIGSWFPLILEKSFIHPLMRCCILGIIITEISLDIIKFRFEKNKRKYLYKAAEKED